MSGACSVEQKQESREVASPSTAELAAREVDEQPKPPVSASAEAPSRTEGPVQD